MSDSLQPHGLQHARIPCPSPVPGAYSNSCPTSQWCQCYLRTISSVLRLTLGLYCAVNHFSVVKGFVDNRHCLIIIRTRWPLGCVIPQAMMKTFASMFLAPKRLAVVQLLSRAWLFVTPWTAACQASLSFTIPRVLSEYCMGEIYIYLFCSGIIWKWALIKPNGAAVAHLNILF